MPEFYVDLPMVTRAKPGTQAARVGARNGHEWCHLWTDGTREELLAFGRRIGMKPAWLQKSRRGLLHFDLTPGRRARAIRPALSRWSATKPSRIRSAAFARPCWRRFLDCAPRRPMPDPTSAPRPSLRPYLVTQRPPELLRMSEVAFRAVLELDAAFRRAGGGA